MTNYINDFSVNASLAYYPAEAATLRLGANYTRHQFSPEKVYFLAKHAFAGAYADETLKKWLLNFYKRFFSQQFKRSCLPDGVKVGSVSLSPRGDWRMPSDAAASLWMDELKKL